jgi:hypothetical protein
MHTPSLKIKEDMQFPKMLPVKQFSEKMLSLKSGLYSSIWIFKTNNFQAQEFLKIYTLVEQVGRNTFHFGSVV